MKTLSVKPVTIAFMIFVLFSSCQKETSSVEKPSAAKVFSVDDISADIAPGISKTVQGFTILVLQPGEAEGQDAWIENYDANPSHADANSGSIDQFKCFAWTINGSPVYCQTLIRFDGIADIPENSNVLYAKMFLYGLSSSPVHLPLGNSYYPGSPYEFFGPNNVYVQRVTSSWDENTVTWNTKPSFTSINKCEIPASNSQWDYNASPVVTKMIRYFVNNPTENYGFILSLANENPYHSMGFYSSEYSQPKKRPKLVIVYK